MIDWAELPAARPKEISSDEPKTLSRGDAHRFYRSRYRSADIQRSLDAAGLTANGDELGARIDALQAKICGANAKALLTENGVSESFGFVFVDRNGVAHPFVGRQHLSALKWALESG